MEKFNGGVGFGRACAGSGRLLEAGTESQTKTRAGVGWGHPSLGPAWREAELGLGWGLMWGLWPRTEGDVGESGGLELELRRRRGEERVGEGGRSGNGSAVDLASG